MTKSLEPPLAEAVNLTQLQFLLQSRQIFRNPETIKQDGLQSLLAGILQAETPDPIAQW